MRHHLTRTLLALATFAAVGLQPAAAQTQAPPAAPHAPRAAEPAAGAAPGADDDALDSVRRQLREQQAEIERLRATVAEQTRLLAELLARTERAESAASKPTAAPALRDASYMVDGVAATDALADAGRRQPPPSSQQQPPGAAAGNPQTEQPGQMEQLKKTTETLSRQLGSISFSGDLRLRYEGTFGQLNALANAENVGLVGNELSARHRARVRARLAIRGQIGRQFDWGLRLATGTTPDVTSTNQTLTDFFGRKSFALDQAYLTYRPAAVPGLRLQGGKFETPWLFTELTWDGDIQPEGINESYSRDFKRAGALRNLSLVAWQLPLLERSSAFVLDAAGRAQPDASRRGGRDLALYGAQARARFGLTPTAALTVSAADLYFSGTQFITPAQLFGGQLQLPVTFTIPATATAPAQTVTTFAAIPRDLLVSGSGLGVSLASTNATNRDGRLASGFNLVDLIARLELTGSRRRPVTLIFNYVTNTQARDVVAAGGRVLENREDQGFWAEFQVGQTRERGDWLLNYTFMRIEKDAVFSPLNFSDIVQQTDVRAHRFIAAYSADPRVTLSFTGLVSERPNGLLGVFGSTPAGSLNRPTTRLQFDTVFRF
jgi:hypothetical protein